MAEERIQKLLAQAGLGSRRACEEYLTGHRVTVNGQLVELGAKADPSNASVVNTVVNSTSFGGVRNGSPVTR